MSSGLGTGWQEDLIDYMINGGTAGRNQSDILRRFQNRATTDMITSELESYQIEKRMQKFMYPPKGGKGRPTTMWRATTKMLELGELDVSMVEDKRNINKVGGNKKSPGRSVAKSANGKSHTKV